MFFLNLIPVIGPLINSLVNGAVSAYTKAQDTKVQLSQIATEKEIEGGKQDVSVIEARLAQAGIFEKDPFVRLARDLILNWGATYYGLILYYSCFHKLIPDYTWIILEVPLDVKGVLALAMGFIFYTDYRGTR